MISYIFQGDSNIMKTQITTFLCISHKYNAINHLGRLSVARSPRVRDACDSRPSNVKIFQTSTDYTTRVAYKKY